MRRRQLEEMLKAEKNRLRTIQPSLQGSVERIIACLQSEKKAVEEQIHQHRAKQKLWQTGRQILESAPGVGMVTSATLLADLPELGKMDRVAAWGADGGDLAGRHAAGDLRARPGLDHNFGTNAVEA